jgi:hypothetical protein
MKDESWRRRRKKEKRCSTFLASGVECVEYLSLLAGALAAVTLREFSWCLVGDEVRVRFCGRSLGGERDALCKGRTY